MLLAFAITSAWLHAHSTGEGQMIDCASAEGAALLMTFFHGGFARGIRRDEREANLLDSGAPSYGVSETAGGKFVSIGSIEPQLYALRVERLGLTGDPVFADQMDGSNWPVMRAKLRPLFGMSETPGPRAAFFGDPAGAAKRADSGVAGRTWCRDTLTATMTAAAGRPRSGMG